MASFITKENLSSTTLMQKIKKVLTEKIKWKSQKKSILFIIIRKVPTIRVPNTVTESKVSPNVFLQQCKALDCVFLGEMKSVSFEVFVFEYPPQSKWLAFTGISRWSKCRRQDKSFLPIGYFSTTVWFLLEISIEKTNNLLTVNDVFEYRQNQEKLFHRIFPPVRCFERWVLNRWVFNQLCIPK